MKIFSKERKVIRALEKQKRDLKEDRKVLTEKLFDVMSAYEQQKKQADKLDKLSEKCYRDAKEYLKKGDEKRAKYYLARRKEHEQTSQEIRKQERVVDMLKDQVRDVDIKWREIEIKIPMIEAGETLGSVLDKKMGLNISDTVKQADKAIEHLQSRPLAAEEMEKEGLTDTVELGYDESGPEVERELEKISKELKAEKLSEEIPMEEEEGEEVKEKEKERVREE